MKKEILLGIGTVMACAAVKEVAKIAWDRYKQKALEETEEEEIIIIENPRN